MATPASIAEGLGIDGEADRDLLWLADKAHAAEAALDHYTYLATVARVPEWASPADAGQLLRNGWYRAVCAAAFEAKEPGELSVQQGEEVLVNGDLLPPAGWANVAAAGFSDATALPAAGKSAIMGGSKRGATATRTAIVRDAATGLLTGL
ncbi:hypothetical protein EMIHUDRAFT_196273 [Emiliania huxleyi CCMP1516]|uniref:SH3 domain-containing protein n=2 Tax=Emiliania huxleyi TaxID=2903 RepID=A0A0D3J3T0_EMIH1|nr:hypothetical protein EMIHUDRAFT_196273 [Emiliania huxleyi CCMP1516]EOD18165.1 hypothetical protein EMIHUDRAFT_196273 [Emiliania huxleyi CCMP1516]|eukprot:XP_005770594.1 hypothetical protein EMIHUDRAFT_196273 [Emiliania huxleyi CCMP1516]